MNKNVLAGFAAAVISVAGQAQPLHAATVTLDGDWYLQAGQVLNLSDPGIQVTGLTYSMGAQHDGAGVWEDYLSGGERQDRLPGSASHYSTQVWSGLQVERQGVWGFDGLDLDRIVRASTGEVDGQNLDFEGVSLRYAYVEVLFSDGYRAHAHLQALGWDVTQVLHIGQAVSPVPEPAAAWMLAVGAGMLWGTRRRADRSA